jgi:hypothetical protein
VASAQQPRLAASNHGKRGCGDVTHRSRAGGGEARTGPAAEARSGVIGGGRSRAAGDEGSVRGLMEEGGGLAECHRAVGYFLQIFLVSQQGVRRVSARCCDRSIQYIMMVQIYLTF